MTEKAHTFRTYHFVPRFVVLIVHWRNRCTLFSRIIHLHLTGPWFECITRRLYLMHSRSEYQCAAPVCCHSKASSWDYAVSAIELLMSSLGLSRANSCLVRSYSSSSSRNTFCRHLAKLPKQRTRHQKYPYAGLCQPSVLHPLRRISLATDSTLLCALALPLIRSSRQVAG